MKILNPTTELSGTYRCKVSSFVDEDFMQRRMIVYGKYFKSVDAVELSYTVMYRKGLTFQENFCSRLRHKTFGGNFFLLHPPRSSSYFRSTWVQPEFPKKRDVNGDNLGTHYDKSSFLIHKVSFLTTQKSSIFLSESI